MVTCGLTSRGPLQLMVVHAVVQRLASVCRMRGQKTIAIYSSRVQHALREVGLSVSLEPQGASESGPRHWIRIWDIL